MIEWRIYYSDGSSFDSTQGSPDMAPSRGFVCAVGYDERGDRYIQNGWDHYWFDVKSCQWWGCDRDGLIDQLCENRVWAYKQGRTVTRSEFSDIMQTAHKDPDFPLKRGDSA